MTSEEPKFRCGTERAINELAKRFDYPNHKVMQDWTYEVANQKDIEKYLNYYTEANEDEKFCLIEMLLEALSETDDKDKFNKYWGLTRKIIIKDFHIHEYTIYYRRFIDYKLSDCCQVTPNIRELWNEMVNLNKIKMTFKYSICYPNKKDIEYKNNAILGDEVIKIAKNFPWLKEIELWNSLNENEIYYNPSLDFVCIENGRSFCLTADYDNTNDLKFSLWYNRPKKTKVFFGLFGDKEKMVVDDVWNISFEKSLQYLEYFVSGKYSLIEELYK